MDRKKIVCFTGHRALSPWETSALRRELRAEIERQIAHGACVFRTGGAVGFDTLAASAVLESRAEHPDVQLELVLPCRDQTEYWGCEDTARYQEILKQANRVWYVSDAYYDGVYQSRDRKLVDGADLCIAFLRSSNGGGTAYTSSYAIKSGLDYVNLAERMPMRA